MRRIALLVAVLGLVVAACGLTSEVPDEDDVTEETDAPEEIAIGEDGEEVVTTTTLPPLDPEDEEDAGGVLEIATLLPIESGRFEGEHWFKWKLGEPVDATEQYVRTFQLNIRSLEDDLFGLGWTMTEGEEPFSTGFCLEDRPNCATGTFPVDVEVLPELNELIFRVPEGTFGEATGLEIAAFLVDFETADSDPVNTDVGDGARAPLGLEERDPC